MQITVPKELHPGETRVPLIPDHAAKLVKAGAAVTVESGIGASIGLTDDDYTAAGAAVSTDRDALLSGGDIVLRIRKPSLDEVRVIGKGALHVSLLDPFNEKDLIAAFAARGVSAVSLEMVPRSTRAQKMDVLSSQANLAGYVAVILAAERLDRILPMMMTPAGTLKPSRVFVIGVGVAGLQAIATAKRLGARVEAFDTRPVVEEQVRSLGAKFVNIDLGETGQTKDGYARELTEEQLGMQREGMAKVCAGSDIVITTAQLFGRRAPLIVTEDMVRGMRPGAVIVDLAVESGGNVAGSRPGEEVDVNGVRILGMNNMPGRVPVDASRMFSSNLFNFLDEFWNSDGGRFELDLEDEIIQSCLITHDGAVVNERIIAHHA